MEHAADSGVRPVTDADTLLAGLRRELDRVDEALLEDVRRRLEICVRIGEVKQHHGIAMLQPARVDYVEARAADYANAHGMSPGFFRALFALLIDETCRLEESIIGGDGHGPAPVTEADGAAAVDEKERRP